MTKFQQLAQMIDDERVEDEHLIAALDCNNTVEEAYDWLAKRGIVPEREIEIG